MEIRGEIKGLSIDYESGNTIVSFLTSSKPKELSTEYEKLRGKLLDVRAVVHRNRRSLDANAYFHVLIGKIAEAQVPPISKTLCKNILICRYGQMLYIDNQPVVIKTQLPPEIMQEQESVHAEPCGAKVENGIEVNYYHIYRGSHTYDTNEMSILINGTVEEAKALGIETLSPDEIARMESLWNGEK